MAITSKLTYAQCQIFTTEEDLVCPVCGVTCTPNLGHYCEKRPDPPKKEVTDGR